MITVMFAVMAFAIGFYLGVLTMSLLAIGRARDVPNAMVFDAAA
jgi:hypothetical protein